MKKYTFGDVVLTVFPYVSGGTAKQRPALVLRDTGDDDMIIALITSKTFRHSTYDVKITDWQQAKLLFPSTVRVHKILTQEKSGLLGQLGKITPRDITSVQSAVQKLWIQNQ